MYGNIVIIDKALIDVTNLNRNLMADTKVVGKYKVDVAKKKLLNINPELNIKIIKEEDKKNKISLNLFVTCLEDITEYQEVNNNKETS